MPVIYVNNIQVPTTDDEIKKKPRKYTEKDLFCSCSMKNKMTKSMKEKLKEHSKHHSKKHMQEMKRLIKNGMNFNQAHNAVMKTIGK